VKPYYQDDWLTVHLGDCRAVMAEMEPESVNCVVTSPPYWGLRDYGTDGQLGLEPTPEAYVESMVAVFREVRRVLRSDGTVWLNLGDTFSSRGGAGGTMSASGLVGGEKRQQPRPEAADPAKFGRWNRDWQGLKPKDLVGIPWRVAFALQADGWYLRSDIIWAKPNPMPESVTDRPTKSHEYLFLLSKSPRYYFDADAVREDQASDSIAAYERAKANPREPAEWKQNAAVAHIGAGATVSPNAAWSDTEKLDRLLSRGRNLRSVWTIATQPYPGAHFATFPSKLVEPCIKAGTSEKGVCPECGSPWEREVERTAVDGRRDPGGVVGLADAGMYAGRAGSTTFTTTGWSPSCRCEHDGGGWAPVPATVLDPFAGSGTTAMVAQSLSRRAVLIDLNADYLTQVMDRNRDIPLGLGA
jgi:DNA modification methylase